MRMILNSVAIVKGKSLEARRRPSDKQTILLNVEINCHLGFCPLKVDNICLAPFAHEDAKTDHRSPASHHGPDLRCGSSAAVSTHCRSDGVRHRSDAG